MVGVAACRWYVYDATLGRRALPVLPQTVAICVQCGADRPPSRPGTESGKNLCGGVGVLVVGSYAAPPRPRRHPPHRAPSGRAAAQRVRVLSPPTSGCRCRVRRPGRVHRRQTTRTPARRHHLACALHHRVDTQFGHFLGMQHRHARFVGELPKEFRLTADADVVRSGSGALEHSVRNGPPWWNLLPSSFPPVSQWAST